MASINVELKSRGNKDGRHTVYIRVTEGKEHKRFITKAKVNKSDFNAQAKHGKWIRTSAANHAVLNEHVKNKYDEIEEELINADGKIKAINVRKSFLKYADDEVDSYYKNGKYRSSDKLKHALNKLREYLGEKDLLFKDLNVPFLKKYETYLRSEKENHVNTIDSDFKRFKTTYANAIQDGFITGENNPFMSYKVQTEVTHREKLNLTELKKLEEAKLDKESNLWHAKNYFLFSFYCAGIRFGDFAVLKWENIIDGRLEYQMSKTKGKPGSQRSVKLLPKAIEILDIYRPEAGGEEGFIFPLLDAEDGELSIPELKKKISSRNASVNRWLKDVALKAKIKKNLSFHIARHSFADIARQKTQDIYSISKLLGHSDIKTTQVYLASFDKEGQDKILEDIFNE